MTVSPGPGPGPGPGPREGRAGRPHGPGRPGPFLRDAGRPAPPWLLEPLILRPQRRAEPRAGPQSGTVTRGSERKCSF